MHAWGEPAETLLQLAPATSAQLVMPRLGEPVQSARVDGVVPWWRGVDNVAWPGTAPPAEGQPAADQPATKAQPSAMTLPRSMPWPVD